MLLICFEYPCLKVWCTLIRKNRVDIEWRKQYFIDNENLQECGVWLQNIKLGVSYLINGMYSLIIVWQNNVVDVSLQVIVKSNYSNRQMTKKVLKN